MKLMIRAGVKGRHMTAEECGALPRCSADSGGRGARKHLRRPADHRPRPVDAAAGLARDRFPDRGCTPDYRRARPVPNSQRRSSCAGAARWRHSRVS